MITHLELDWLRWGQRLSIAIALVLILSSCQGKIENPFSSDKAAAPLVIYDDALAEPWQNWSWDTQQSLADPISTQSGCEAISVSIQQAWGGFYLHSDQPVKTAGYTHITFYVNSEPPGNQSIRFLVNKNEDKTFQFTVPIGGWSLVSIPLTQLGSPENLTDLFWQDASGSVQQEFHLDSISLVNMDVPEVILGAPECTVQQAQETTALPVDGQESAASGTETTTDAPSNGESPTQATEDMPPVVIYDDALNSGWQDWSWDVQQDLIHTDPVQSGPTSISVEITGGWGAFYLHRDDPISTDGYTHLQFFVHGGSTGGQHINVQVNDNKDKVYSITPTANQWTQVAIPLSALGSPKTISDLFWQDAQGQEQAEFYLDEISLVAQSAGGAESQAAVEQTVTAIPAGTKFVTLPPGSVLPSEEACAAAVKSAPENKGINLITNATPGNQSLSSNFFGASNDSRSTTEIAPRVTGNFTGTTDEILQWAACKWGVDEDMVRAQAAVESWWRQDTKGDWTSDASRCAPGHELGVDGKPGECPESFGILQNRYPYEQGTWPGIDQSTAFNADTAYAIWRSCYEGYDWWLNNVDRGAEYSAGDAWGCMGRWFSGRWYTDDAETYIAKVKDYFNSRIWETTSFQEP